MNDIRRMLLWIIFAASLVFLWDKWQIHNGNRATFFPTPAATSVKSTSAGTTQNAAGTSSDVPTSTAFSNTNANTATATSSAQTSAAAASAPPDLITVTTDVYKLKFDPIGGSLVYAELLAQRDIINKHANMVLFDHSKERLYSAQTGLSGEAGLPNHTTRMTPVIPERELAPGANTLPVRFEAMGEGASAGVKLAKTYTLQRGSYAIDVKNEVINQGTTSVAPQLYVRLIRDGNEPAGGSSFYSTFTGPVVYSSAKKYQKISFSDINKDKASFEKLASDGYVGMVQHYFVSAWLTKTPSEHENFVRKLGDNLYTVGMIFPGKTLAAGQSETFDTQLYAGPQDEKKLEALAPGFDLVKDYGYFTILSKPLFWVIDKLHGILGNWGWSIVAVVVLLKIAFYWFNAKAYSSMGKMKAISPRITEMRERLKDKPQQMQQEMMRIYREEKINPLGGCLPIVIQMPFFIALYWVLLSSVEFRGAPWILWVKDLSTPDPWFVLPLLMTATSLLQTWLNPTPPDPMQAKLMWIMPLAFSFMFFFFPAGLVLYWLVNNILSIAQQWLINKRLGVS